MVKFAVEFWRKMLLAIFPAKEVRKSSSTLRRKFATNFAKNFANFTLEIAGQHFYFSHRPHLFLGVDACRDPSLGSVFGRFLVGFRSVLTETDQKLTKNRPQVDPLQGVRSECAVYER